MDKQQRHVKHPRVKRALTEDEIQHQRRKTAERVRRYRERKKNQSGSTGPPLSKEQRIKAVERMRRYRQRKLEERRLSTLKHEDLFSGESQLIDGEKEQDIVSQYQRHQKSDISDPLEFVNVHFSPNEKKNITQLIETEEIIVGIDKPERGSVLGPSVHGMRYRVKEDMSDEDYKINVLSNKEIEIPSLKKHYNILKCVSDYYIRTAELNIAGQVGLPTATYNVLCTLTPPTDLSISLDQFVRMWRTILLRRVQEVETKMTGLPNTELIPLEYDELLVPAPLRDLLYSIGSFHSTALGVVHQTLAPRKPENPPDWWDLDDEIIMLWNQTMHILKNRFTMKRTPLSTDYDDKALMMTQIQISADHMVECRAKTNEIGISDGYVHMMNDPLYSPCIYPFEECHISISSPVNQGYLRTGYLQGYIILDECF